MAREKKRKGEQPEQQAELNPEAEERKRLKKLAHSNNILSETPLKSGFSPLTPSKTVIKHHGKDILKKSQRKNRYLFSFSGLLAPISGGKIGELTNLGSKNPVLYLDFPQGRMKLFGTIVFPKNKYLTLQFSRGGKNVMCEDCFDTMVVFSDAYWVGKKEDNPEEVRLDFPKELFEGNNVEVDFQGGAGATAMQNEDAKKVSKPINEDSLPESPLNDLENESSEEKHNTKDMTNNSTPVRHSERTAGKKFQFAEVSSGDDSAETVGDMFGEENETATKSSNPCSPEQDHGTAETATGIDNSDDIQLLMTPNREQTGPAALSNSETKESSRGSLVQTTISTLFKKVEVKNSAGGSRKMSANKDSNKKTQKNCSTPKSKKTKASELEKANISQDKQAGKRSDCKKLKAEATEVEDDIEEFTSLSEESDGSDEDWSG